jgi:hypothetical protein
MDAPAKFPASLDFTPCTGSGVRLEKLAAMICPNRLNPEVIRRRCSHKLKTSVLDATKSIGDQTWGVVIMRTNSYRINTYMLP